MDISKYYDPSNGKDPTIKKVRDYFNTQLFEDFHVPLLITSYSYGFRGEDARDVVSGFFEDVILPKKQFMHFWSIVISRESNFESYLHRCFKNHCIAVLKKKKRELENKTKFIDLKCETFQTYHYSPDRAIIIDKVLSYLPQRQQMVVFFWLHGFSHKEIADKIEFRASVTDRARTIRNIFFRAIVTLKKLFGGNEELRSLLNQSIT